MKYVLILISVYILFDIYLDILIIIMPNSPDSLELQVGGSSKEHWLWLEMKWYHCNIANTFSESNKKHDFNKQLIHELVWCNTDLDTSFDYQDEHNTDNITPFKDYLENNIDEINITELLKEKKYRDPAYQPWCVDSRQSNNIIQVPGGMLLLYETCLAGMKRGLGDVNKNRFIDDKERETYRDFINQQSDIFLTNKPYLWCHCSDKYCEHNKEWNYEDINHIWCGALNFFVDDNQSDYFQVLKELKSTPKDVQYMRSLISNSYKKDWIKILEWWYNADWFIFFDPILYKKDNQLYAKSIKNNKNNGKEFFVYDSVITELVAEDIVNDLSKQLRDNMDWYTQHIVEKIVEYWYEIPDNKLISNIADDANMPVYDRYMLLNRYKTLKTLRARIKYIASNLQPVVDVISKNEDKQTLFHIEL